MVNPIFFPLPAFLLLQFFHYFSLSLTVPPTWVTSSYFRADSKKLINGDLCNCATGNSSRPTATINFPSPFAFVPNLAYGISSYQGQDGLAPEQFEVNRTGLTTTSYSVAIQIYGRTNIWVMQIRYIAVSKLFPHHVNSFDNVPINYTFGPLVNISVESANLQTFTNTINYTAQASGSPYKNFSLPLSNNKILLFMTTLYVSGTPDLFSPLKVNLVIDAFPVSNTSYTIFVSIEENATINKLHFSMIVFDQYQVQQTRLYVLIYQRITFGISQGFYAFPSQFLSNFMVGFLSFTTDQTLKIINCLNSFSIVNGTYGMYKNISSPKGVFNPVRTYTFNIFYLKTWTCPNNTFINHTSNMCTDCILEGCSICTDLTICQECNHTSAYYFKNVSSSTCSYCNPATNHFINFTTLSCEPCAINNCLICQSLLSCLNCDISLNYLVNLTDNLCYLCTIQNCLNCSSFTTCINCDSNSSYYLSAGQCLYCNSSRNQFINITDLGCQSCQIFKCLVCQSLISCLICNTEDDYFLNFSTKICESCNILGCIKCTSLASCQVCDYNSSFYKASNICSFCNNTLNLFINQNTFQCQPCSIDKCLNCSSILTCEKCDQSVNYILNSSDGLCYICEMLHCVLCQSYNTCLICNTSNNYYLNSQQCSYCDPFSNLFINLTSGNCQPCTLMNCINCSSLFICQQCDSALNYFLNLTDYLCYQCILNNCIICSSLNTCLLCDQQRGFILELPNEVCVTCPASFFINYTSHQCQICTIPNCLSCSSLTSCFVCDTNNSFYLFNSTCTYCDSNQNQFIDMATLICEKCTLNGCINCSSLTNCLICDINFQLVNGSCLQVCLNCDICGNNIVEESQACDDGNKNDEDGCSTFCLIQQDFMCELSNSSGLKNSQCFYIGQIFLKILYIKKAQFSNQIQFLIKVYPKNTVLWDGLNFSQIISIVGISKFDGISVEKNKDQTLSVFFNYYEDIHNTQVKVLFNPALSGKQILSKVKYKTNAILVIPDDNQFASFYTQENYQIAKIVQKLGFFIAGFSLIVFIIAIAAGKLIGIQMVGVVQVSFLSLIMLPAMNPCFKALSSIYLVNGFSYFSLSEGHLLDDSTPSSVKGLKLYSFYIKNVNLNIILIILAYLVAFITFLISKTILKNREKGSLKMINFSKRCACQVAFNLIQFSVYVSSVSIGLHIAYSGYKPEDFLWILSIFGCSLIFLLFIIYFFLLLKVRKYFGQFVYLFLAKNDRIQKQKNKDEKEKGNEFPEKKRQCKVLSKWYNILLFQRMAVGGLLVTLMNVEYGFIPVIIIYCSLLIITVVFKPYFNTRNNVRFCINMAAIMSILLIFLSYKVNWMGEEHSDLWIYFPLFVCILLIIVIIYNLLFLIYEICVQKRRKDSEKKFVKSETQYTTIDVLPERTLDLQQVQKRMTLKELKNSLKKELRLEQITLNQLMEANKLEFIQNSLSDQKQL